MHDWVIGFDKKAQEKRDRDRDEKEKRVDVFAMGSEKNGEDEEDVKVRKMDVVVDEVDCVHRKGGKTSAMNDGMPLEEHHSSHSEKAEDGVWITTRPGVSPTHSLTTTASSSYEPRSPLQTMCCSANMLSPDIISGTEERSGYFDALPTSDAVVSTNSSGCHILEPIPEAKFAEATPPSAMWRAIEGVRAADKVKSPTPPPLSKTKRSNSAPDKGKSGGWFGLSVTKALGVM